MTDWNYIPEHPISLTIAADARLSQTNYTNDQIWELNFGDSDPPSLCLQTTFGLRARNFRIFPRFIHAEKVINNPEQFHRPITIHKYFPNYLSLSFRPFSSIDVHIDYWVPESQVVAARSKIRNLSRETCLIQLEWIALLVPSPDGDRMAISEIGMNTILAGQTSDLYPVFFLTGGVQAGNSPYPSLYLNSEIPPHAEQDSLWAIASLQNREASFELTKQMVNKNWDAEFARVYRINSQQLEITTGNHEWNTAFYLAQTISNQLIIHANDPSKSLSYVYTRKPDQGFSLRKDGTDYNHLWNGQTSFDAYYLTNFILPSYPTIMRSILDNFLATQTANGEIDWKPGLGGQRSHLLATPLLATLAWNYYNYNGDINYLKDVFPKLTKFYLSWFSTIHDHNNNSVPEWDQTVQTGFEEHPLFSYANPWSEGLDITTVESPDLLAYLYQECSSLISIGKTLEDYAAISILEKSCANLSEIMDQFWSDQHACYLYRDRDSQLSPQGILLGRQMGSGVMQVNQQFQMPIRPIIHFKSKKERTHRVQVYIHGISPTGTHRVDHISAHSIRWHIGSGFVTSEYIYQAIEQIEINEITDDVEVIAHSADLTGIYQNLLLPLWARMLPENKASILINLTILNKKVFLGPYGLRPNITSPEEMDNPKYYDAMHLPWMSMILEGVVHYGMQNKAAEVFTRIMKAVVQSLKKDMKFHQFYHSENGEPLGTVNSLNGLIPIGLFLKILGVNIVSSTQIEITGHNPFPWPVTIKFRGLTLVQKEQKTLVIFPEGQSITIDNDHPQTIFLKNN